MNTTFRIYGTDPVTGGVAAPVDMTVEARHDAVAVEAVLLRYARSVGLAAQKMSPNRIEVTRVLPSGEEEDVTLSDATWRCLGKALERGVTLDEFGDVTDGHPLGRVTKGLNGEWYLVSPSREAWADPLQGVDNVRGTGWSSPIVAVLSD